MPKEGDGGNVIRPQFGKGKKSLEGAEQVPESNKKTPQPEQGSVGSPEFNERIYNDYLYTKTNRPDVVTALRRCEEATSYIFDVVKYRKNDESVALRQGAIGKMSLKEMCARVSESGPLQWREKPAFFGAIVLEMDWRLTVIQQVEDVVGKK